jgi:hypothetical protein
LTVSLRPWRQNLQLFFVDQPFAIKSVYNSLVELCTYFPIVVYGGSL